MKKADFKAVHEKKCEHKKLIISSDFQKNIYFWKIYHLKSFYLVGPIFSESIRKVTICNNKHVICKQSKTAAMV